MSEEREGVAHTFRLGVLEIYNERVVDLLADDKPALELKLDEAGEVRARGLTLREVQGMDDVVGVPACV